MPERSELPNTFRQWFLEADVPAIVRTNQHSPSPAPIPRSALLAASAAPLRAAFGRLSRSAIRNSEARFASCPPRAFMVSRSRSTSPLDVPARSMKLSCLNFRHSIFNEAVPRIAKEKAPNGISAASTENVARPLPRKSQTTATHRGKDAAKLEQAIGEKRRDLGMAANHHTIRVERNPGSYTVARTGEGDTGLTSSLM